MFGGNSEYESASVRRGAGGVSQAETARKEKEAVQDTPSLRALGLAHYWQWLLDEGKHRSITDIAAAEGMDLGQASRVVQLTRLAPEIVEACLAGKDDGWTLERVMRRSIPLRWWQQATQFRGAASNHMS